MAGNANCRETILQSDGLRFLLRMLQSRVVAGHSQAEAAATERVQKKSAIALSR